MDYRLHQKLGAAALAALLISPCGFAQQATPNAPAPATSPTQSIAQQAAALQQTRPVTAQHPFHVEMPHSRNPFAPYRPSTVPPLNLTNSPRLMNLVRDGKLYLSLRDAVALALENNLDIVNFRYNLPIAKTDLARTKAGGFARGVNTSVVQGTQGGFSSTGVGAGTGTAAGAGAAGAGGLVQSTLGSGTAVRGFDPQLSFQAYVDHSRQALVNPVLNGIPSLETNTIGAQSTYSQAFPLGTYMEIDYQGMRQTQNSPAYTVNPSLYSTFTFTIDQPLLAGFGFATNERYIHIAKRNSQVTDLAFKAQVIATITQVENIYWDLVAAYQDVQVKQRSLDYAKETLSDDQKQLQLQNIPAMQVMKDQSAVATSQGDLTVAKADLKLNELLIKNALTKAIDPNLADMPVVPLDRKGPPDPNAGKSIDQLIAEAEKNRPDVSIDQLKMETAQNSLKSNKNALLPSLDLYGQYTGYGRGGPVNPACNLGPEFCASTLPTSFGGVLGDTFNYSSPDYQVGFQLDIALRNRVAKADQFRSMLEYRQDEVTFEQQKKNIRFDVRNAQYALEQAEAQVEALTTARDLAQKTFQIVQQEQKLGAKSRSDTLSAEHDLSVAESALFAAQTKLEKANVNLDRSTGSTLDRMHVSIDDARSGVVTHMP